MARFFTIILAIFWIGSAAAEIDAAAELDAAAEIDAAANTVEQSIEAIVAAEGEFSDSLIEPLIELARQRHEQGDLAGEVDALRRAQHIIHRNRGVHSLRQLGIIETLSEIHLDQEKPEDANREQELLLYLAERNHGEDSPELLPAIKALTTWYAQTGQLHRARRLNGRSMEIIRSDGGEQDIRLVDPLLMAARIKRLQRSSGGYDFIEQAQEIVDANATVASDQKAAVYAALGDAYTMSGKEEAAASAYAKVPGLIGKEASDKLFETPRIITQSRELNAARNARKDVYQREQELFGSIDRGYRRLTLEERLVLESTEPELFVIARERPRARYHLPDAYNSETIEDELRMVGYPIQFVASQLQTILPFELQDEEALAELVVTLSFTVNPDGNATDIVIETPGIPTKLSKLMRRVLSRAKFRPKIVDGTPVKTEHFMLTQRFDR